MDLMPLFRFIAKRLKSLTRPIPLVSGVTLVILAIFISEYVKHPEWFGTYSQEGDEPNPSLDLSSLTPEEQAAVADIDNLSVLFNDLGISQQGNPTIQAIPQDVDQAQDSLFQDLLVLSESAEAESSLEGANPFQQYLNQYRFIGQTPQGNIAGSSIPNNLPGALPTVSQPGTSALFQTGSSVSPNRTSALQQALNNQGPATVATPIEEGSDAALSNGEEQLPNGSEPTATSSDNSAPSNSEGLGSQAVTIPGVAFPVLPTTPEMSPPTGTTGYTPPASLEYVQPIPGSNSTSSFPTSGTTLPSPSSAGVPSIPSAGSATPNLATPQVDVSNGAVTPSLPSTAAPPAAGATPSPFSVPRPPGSYIGGGYINTFSNPSKPPE
ncbi:MAG: hypothetical protein AAGE59_37875 [Cyanobacteria bacterium P01_F01_bin.86]